MYDKLVREKCGVGINYGECILVERSFNDFETGIYFTTEFKKKLNSSLLFSICK